MTPMINHPLRCIYIHIPKTAGNSINRIFGIGWENHKDLQRYADELPAEVMETYYKFAIVRNPWDRLVSDYNYQRKKSRDRQSKLFTFHDSGKRRNFCDWVRAALADPHRYEPASWGGEVSKGIHRWSPQLDWISVGGRNQLDFVARIEHLAQDFGVVCRTLGLPEARLPHRNRRLHSHYSWYYDEPTREFVASYYARDIAAFGYRFETSPAVSTWRQLQSAAGLFLTGLHVPVTPTSLRSR